MRCTGLPARPPARPACLPAHLATCPYYPTCCRFESAEMYWRMRDCGMPAKHLVYNKVGAGGCWWVLWWVPSGCWWVSGGCLVGAGGVRLLGAGGRWCVRLDAPSALGIRD